MLPCRRSSSVAFPAPRVMRQNTTIALAAGARAFDAVTVSSVWHAGIRLGARTMENLVHDGSGPFVQDSLRRAPQPHVCGRQQ